jgi:hypothetical protein
MVRIYCSQCWNQKLVTQNVEWYIEQLNKQKCGGKTHNYKIIRKDEPNSQKKFIPDSVDEASEEYKPFPSK